MLLYEVSTRYIVISADYVVCCPEVASLRARETREKLRVACIQQNDNGSFE